MHTKLVGFAMALAIVAFAQIAAAQLRPGTDTYVPPQSTEQQQGPASGPTPNAIGPSVDSPEYDANRDPPPRRSGRPILRHKEPTPSYRDGFNTGVGFDPDLNDSTLAPDQASAQRACMQNCMSGNGALGYDACYKSCFD